MAIPSNAGRSLSSEEKTASKVEGPRRSARDSSRIQLRGLGEQKGRYDRSYVYDEILQDPGENIQIVQFPLSNQLGQRRHSSNKNEGGGERDEEQVLAVAPSCKPFVLDFQRAADGRLLPGGTFVENEWSHGFGIKIKAFNHEGKKSLHPMIFDSLHVESNGLSTNEVFFLGSPNFECGGFGVGRGGREGQLGENCNALGNLLLPSGKSGSSKKQKDSSSSQESAGGVLMFVFKQITDVQRIGLLNAGDNSTVEIIHPDSLAETINVTSVGVNGYQSVDVSAEDVEKIYISLSTFSGVSSIDLCVYDNLPSVNENDETEKDDEKEGRNGDDSG